MKIIESKDNPIYKLAIKLTRKKYRDETGLYLIEGRKPVEDAFATGTGIDTVFLCEGSREDVKLSREGTVVLDRKLFRNLSDTESSQGMIAIAKKKNYDLKFFLEEILQDKQNLIIIDRLQDPGNTGTVIRTAEAAGYGGIVLLKGSADVYAPKIVRAAAGSLFRMPIVYGEQQEVIRMLKKAGKKLTAASPDAKMMYRDADLSEDIALIIGNEGQGIDRELMASADMKVKIPMAGSIESLNAAVAAGILMYQSQKIKSDER
ncbi:MAG: RNA methyltransferase [Bacillota bacterium]|nr:RNA methyltransferase [Bacillota bacterium]